MPQLRMLFIDDNANSIYTAKTWVESIPWTCNHVLFPSIEDSLDMHQPHIAIIDLMQGTPPHAENQGEGVFDKIWTHRFCPIIVYSAFPEEIDPSDQRKKHPFVIRVKKGADLTDFQKAVEALTPHAKSIQEAEQHIRQQYAVALREVAPYVAEVFTPDTPEYNEAIKRHGRRRLAAQMDEMTLGKLMPWEKYIHPPISGCLQLGDVMRLKNGDQSNPLDFKVILTPSCDLFFEEGRQPKVKDVLVAECEPIKKLVDIILSSTKLPLDKLDEWFPTFVLSQGFYRSHIPFPSLKGKIPLMAANLKKLSLIPIADIQDKTKYELVASLDSPFRELVSWAYMQNACRPGLPDRDYKKWADEIKTEFNA